MEERRRTRGSSVTQTNGVTHHVGIPRRTIGVVAALLVCAGTVLGGCASSGPPKSRTVLFVRPDLNFTVVWDAAVETLSTEFRIAEERINTRTILTDYRYDDREPAKIRWRVKATVIEIEENWGVRISTLTERNSGSGWREVGLDDPTSQYLVRRINERVQLAAGPAPSDPRFAN